MYCFLHLKEKKNPFEHFLCARHRSRPDISMHVIRIRDPWITAFTSVCPAPGDSVPLRFVKWRDQEEAERAVCLGAGTQADIS